MKQPLSAWDTCVFLDYVDRTHPKVSADDVTHLDRLVQEAIDADVGIVIPAVVVAEVSKFKDEHGTPHVLTDPELDKVRGFLRRKPFDVRPIDRAIAFAAQDLMRLHGLALMDALVVATCLHFKLSTLLTRDGTGRKKKTYKLIKHDKEFGTPPLRVMSPAMVRAEEKQALEAAALAVRRAEEAKLREEAPMFHPEEKPGT